MNHSLIFQRVYCQPLLLSVKSFLSIHAVVRPRLLGQASMTDLAQYDKEPRYPVASKGRKQRPRVTYGADGRTVIDDRLYGMAAPGIAVVAAKGVLARNVSWIEEACMGMSGYEPIAAALLQADGAAEVEQIILDVDSPGGECIGCFELADLIASLTKPVIGFTEGLACSSAECLISQCDENYVTRSAYRGSIGVIMGILDDTGALADAGFKMEFFTAGEGKATGYSGYQLSDADKATEQARVDYYYSLFADCIQRTRGDVDPLQQKTAQVYVGEQAVDAGLADGIVASFDELVEMMTTPA